MRGESVNMTYFQTIEPGSFQNYFHIFLKYLIIVFHFVYLLFSIIVFQQIRIMSHTIKPINKKITIIGLIFFLIALGSLIAAFIVL
jgi:uncharacterized protein DUF5657